MFLETCCALVFHLVTLKREKKRKKGKSFFHILIFTCFSYTVLLEDMSKDYFIMNLKAIKISTKFIYLFCLLVFLFHSLNVKVNISDILYTFNTQHSKYLVNKKINYYLLCFDYHFISYILFRSMNKYIFSRKFLML